jgi:glycosyltransferase involved in cell wall biosynthesis
MLHHALSGGQRQTVFGVQTAVEGFVRAYFQFGTATECNVFTPVNWAQSAQSALAGLADEAEGPTPRVWTLDALPARVAAEPPVALHDHSGNLWRGHLLRSRLARGTYPITTIHYTASYVQWRHQHLLPLLLAGYRPYDALICHGAAARTAIAALIEEMRDAVREEYGLVLPFEGRLEIIPLGVNTDLYRPRDRADARHSLKLPQDRVIILGLGRFSLEDKMDLAPLLNVFKQLRDSCYPRPLLVLAGSDPEGPAGQAGRLTPAAGAS